jgi:hypothetical protein
MMGLPDSLQTSPDLAPIVILKQLLDAATNLVKDPTVQRAFLESSFPKTFCEALTAWLVDRPPKRRGPEVVKEGFTLVYKCLRLLGNKGTTADRLCLRAFESMLDGGMFSLFTYALETIPDKDSELGDTLNAILLVFKPHCLYPRAAATILEQCLLRGGLERVRGPIAEKSRINGVYWTWLILEVEVATEVVAFSDEGKIIQLCDNLKVSSRTSFSNAFGSNLYAPPLETSASRTTTATDNTTHASGAPGVTPWYTVRTLARERIGCRSTVKNASTPRSTTKVGVPLLDQHL